MLIDQENDPESGIDIIAQPPGKRLQNVQLLSGGEKALTAMALMFAIFKYRPSPFCLLDEIDAPLDDANIGRFVEMLQGMQDAHAVHPHHAQPQDDGNRGPAVRRDDGRARRVEADFGADELSHEAWSQALTTSRIGPGRRSYERVPRHSLPAASAARPGDGAGVGRRDAGVVALTPVGEDLADWAAGIGAGLPAFPQAAVSLLLFVITLVLIWELAVLPAAAYRVAGGGLTPRLRDGRPSMKC